MISTILINFKRKWEYFSEKNAQKTTAPFVLLELWYWLTLHLVELYIIGFQNMKALHQKLNFYLGL